MSTKLEAIYKPVFSTKCGPAFFEAVVPAGFPSPADDYQESKLDLNKYLIKHPAATFFVRACGDSMIGVGIHCGDLLVVDRSVEPRDKNVVIAAVDGELTVKRIRIRKKEIILEPENESYTVQKISKDAEFEIWGVVTNVIHKL